MHASVTTGYAAVLAIMLIGLAINVTVHRAKRGVPIGGGDDPKMVRMMRIHGNAAEYLPMGLLLMLLDESGGGSPVALRLAGAGLVIGRVLYGWGMWKTTAPTFGRIAGTTLTWVVILALAVLNLMRIA